MLEAIFAILLPVLGVILKEFLPQIVGKLLSNWLSPPTPIDQAKVDLDKSIVEGDLLSLSTINHTIIDKSKQDLLGKDQLNSMLEFADEN